MTKSFSASASDGASPQAALIADAKGDLFGTTTEGGANGDGTVFELVKTASGYTEQVLHSFSYPTDGAIPQGGLIADANGDLFGTTSTGGAYGGPFGTVFELVKTGSGYTEKILHSFSGADGYAPYAGLIADANGDLFGTNIAGGAHGYGTVFELVKTGSGYTEKVLHSFRGGTTDGFDPYAGLIADAKGDLFGTTFEGGGNDDGTVFELVKTGSGYTEKLLHSFSGYPTDGANPDAGLIANAKGDLFGTTEYGGASSVGTVFELVKTGSGYTEKILHSFGVATKGFEPYAGLIADTKGDLFGTTYGGGANGEPGRNGTVFELVKTGSGYTEKILHSFSGGTTDGDTPLAGLIADANGDLFGTTAFGGAYGESNGGDGTAFELVKTASGYTEKILHSFSGTSADTTTSNVVVALSSLLPPVLGAETYTRGGLAYHSEGNFGDRDAWGVGVGEHNPIGHGAGPG